MGQRGPAPTPTKVLQMRGTHRPDRHGDPAEEPQYDTLKALPPVPGFFDEMAVAEWNRVGAELIAKELLTEVDLAAFSVYCLNVSRLVACEKVLKSQGMTYMAFGAVTPRPEVAIARQCGEAVRKFAQEFGLTPSARTRIRTPAKAKAEKPANPWEQVG